ncbi:hypothetical protein [Ligilactobacillus faecis]|uniref:Methanol dehydrogenase n=1 Tax=Ligilactobacillus faecis TaxID=762833 RepID=A0ABV4DMS7_9LACO|nr:hypothetical protein [Ligilactobacillus faecis]WGN88845.1 hypothetical protein QFX10_07205 [Ligilactobacillus faecis]
MKKTKKQVIAYVLVILLGVGILATSWVHRDELLHGYENGFEQLK